MKKYINKVLLPVSLAIISIACSDELELDDPQNAKEEIALSTSHNVEAILTGAYNALSKASIFGGNTLRNSELLGANDEIYFGGTFTDPNQIFNKGITTVNSNVADLWIDGYETINNANFVLDAIDVVDEEIREKVKGEALFIRGLTYFELVKFFAKPYADGNASINDGIPLVFKPGREVDESSAVTRESVEKVYTQIIQDLTDAANLLGSGTATRASQGAAYAILSRVYLQMGNFSKAAATADSVIKSDNYELNKSYAECFNGGTTSEDIFNIPVSTSDGVNNMQLFFAAKKYGGRADIEILSNHLDLYEEGDSRLDLFYKDRSRTRSGKWTNKYGNVKIVRLAEMYLTRAEANFRLGTEVGDSPLNDVNLIRERAGLDPLIIVTLDTLIHERRVELAHEGHQIHDIKRLKRSVTEESTTYAYDDPKLVFPIPQRERNVNKNLTQNPGYGNN